MNELVKDSHREVVFNLGLSLSQQISNLLEQASKEYKNGELEQWFFSQKGIKLKIINRLKPEERKELEELELMVTRFLNLQQTIIVKNKLSRIIELYQTKIMEFLEFYGFLPLKKDRTNIFEQGED